MANSAQARKRARQADKQRSHNASQRSTLRTAIKRVRQAIEAGDKAAAQGVFQQSVAVLDRIADKKIVHKNKASRTKSRLSAQIKALGRIKQGSHTIEYDLYDQYAPLTKTSSMARTTGYTCSAAVNLVARKLFTELGVFPPELVGKNKTCFDFILDYLKKRGVNWKKSER